jgi:hypothetical protein
MPVDPNAHPDSHMMDGEVSQVPHPPKDDHPDPKVSGNESKPFPYTGWDGPIPSKDGGDKVLTDAVRVDNLLIVPNGMLGARLDEQAPLHMAHQRVRSKVPQ